MRTDFDVVIVGGGLVGAALAAALKHTPLSIALVEAAPASLTQPPSYDDRTLALAYGSRRIFEGIGVWEAIAERGAMPLRRIHISNRGRFGITRLDASDADLDALGYVVTFRNIGIALYEAIAKQPNVTIIAPATVQALTIDDQRAEVRIQTEQGEQTLTTRLVAAADGANSAVRDMMGIETDRRGYTQTAVVTAVTPEQRPAETAYERFTDSGPLAFLPADGERFAVVWTVDSTRVDTVLGWDDDTFRRELQECFGERLGKFLRVGKRQAYPLTLTRVREHVRPRLALIGNAAHSVHPVAGQGFNLGLRDVAALAEILNDGTANERDPGDIAALRQYADWRVRDNRITSTFTHSLIQIFSNDYLPFALGRNLGLIAVDLLPAVKRRLIHMTSGLSGRLPRLARGLPLSP